MKVVALIETPNNTGNDPQTKPKLNTPKECPRWKNMECPTISAWG